MRILRAVSVVTGTGLVVYGLVLAAWPAALILIGCLFAYAGASKENPTRG